MDEKRKIPLEEQFKEAELEKLKKETAEVEKRLKQSRVMGVPLVQIIFGGIVVGFILLNYLLPINSLNAQLADKEAELATLNSDYNKTFDWIERVKLDSANLALDRKSKQLKHIADSANKELAKLNNIEVELKSNIDSLKQFIREIEDDQLTVRSLPKKNSVQNRFIKLFPELAMSDWGVANVYNEEANVAIEYLMVPLWFSETFIIDHQNSIRFKENRSKINQYDSLKLVNKILKDSLITLNSILK